jgi:hypothetical protein
MNARRRRNLLFLAIALTVMGPAVVEAGMGVSVSPSRFRFKRPAGESCDGIIVIENNGTHPVRISTEVADMVARLSEDGFTIRDEAPAGTTPHSCARWIQVMEGEGLNIPPGQTGSLRFVLTPPGEITSGGYGAYLFVLATPQQPDRMKNPKTPQATLVTIPRLGVSVIYEVEGAIQRKGNLKELDFIPPTASNPMEIRYRFENTGNAEVILTGTLHITDSQDMLVGKGSLEAIKTFPKEEGRGKIVWTQHLPKGRYTALVTFELGPDPEEIIVREFHFEVTE